MKKDIVILLLLLTMASVGFAQNTSEMDSLRHELSIAKNDSSRAVLLQEIGSIYRRYHPDSSFFYLNKLLVLARKINSPELETRAMAIITLSQLYLGNDARAMQINLKAVKIAENNALLAERPELLIQSGRIYNMSNDYSNALNSFRKAKTIADSTNNVFFIVMAPCLISETFLYMNQPDSALIYARLAYDNALKFNNNLTSPLYVLGKIYFEKGNYELALKYLHEALPLASNNADNYFDRAHKIAQIYQQMGIPDSSNYYANRALEVSLESKIYSNIIEANILLSDIYEKKEPEKALQYSKSAIAYKDTLDFIRKKTTLEDLTGYDAQERQYEIEQAETVYKNRIQRLWIFSIAGALLSALFVAFILFRNNKNKQKANVKLKEQKEEVESTLEKLEATQSQLIQSEKMASLGELTAGIAHEIQNPLNFVNNFSEVSKDLIDEMQEELGLGNPDVAREISEDVKQNLDKIHHHGQRASGIVKGMLEHSRTGDGVKEPTDINALADEYLRLAYHGLRAKDKSFNADFKTEFDESLPKVNIVPQDIGRVMLNLINNAFYAVSEKAARHSESKGSLSAGRQESGAANNEYKPEVIVTTKATPLPGGAGFEDVQISVKDNGPGIPEQVRDKIFQPFFTTKPTGSGTGLGLSLSYDIVKAHGGELKVESTENKGTEFIIQLINIE